MTKQQAKEILRQQLIKKDPTMATVFAMNDIKNSMDNHKEVLEALKKDKTLSKTKIEVNGAISELQGPQGDPGYTPIKGKDYFDGHTPTDAELIALIKPLIPAPIPGKTPTSNELLSLIKPLIPEVKNGETPSDERLIGLIKELIPEIPEIKQDTPEEIATKLNTLEGAIDASVIKGGLTSDAVIKELKKKQYLEPKDIKGMPIDMRWHGGGLTKVTTDGTTITGDGTASSPLVATAVSENYKTAITAADTTPDYLISKLVAGIGITLTKQNTGGNENILIDSQPGFTNPMTTVGDMIYEAPAFVSVASGTVYSNYQGGGQYDFDFNDNIIPNPIPLISQSTPEYYVKFTSGTYNGQIFRIVICGSPPLSSSWSGKRWIGVNENVIPTAGDTFQVGQYTGVTPARLPIGADGKVLTVVSGIPSWETSAGSPQTPWTSDIETAGFKLLDNAITPLQSIDPSSRTLYANDGTNALIDWTGTYDTKPVSFNLDAETSSVYRPIFSKGISDSSSYLSIDPTSRVLYASNVMTNVMTPALNYSNGATAIHSKSFVLTNPTSATDGPVWRTPEKITITAVHVLCVDGTSITGQIDIMDVNGGTPVPVGDDIVGTVGTNVDDDGSLTAPWATAGKYIGWHTTSVDGAVTKVVVTYEFIEGVPA